MSEIEKIFRSVVRCYSNAFIDKLPTLQDFENEPVHIRDNIFHKSVRLRVNALMELKRARDLGLMFDSENIWSQISESIKILPVEATISSVGSQGFLSIPLLKHDSEIEDFEFIRLHVWDTSINKYVNIEARDNFSIHNHLFDAESWILCGQIINDRYMVKRTEKHTENSYFTIEYNDTLNEINQHTSKAVNTNIFADLTQLSHEIYYQGGNYFIEAGDFHRSGSNSGQEISATLFSFTGNRKCIEHSSVIGPSKIRYSEINRKQIIDPTELVRAIDNKMK